MTLNEERVSAVADTRKFLFELIDPEAIARVPKAVRARARRLLRHYPSPYEAERVWPPQFDKPRYT